MMRFLPACLALLLSACSTPGTLTYAPSVPSVLPGPPVVSAVSVADKRDEKPSRVATIRGGYGNPVKVLDTTEPVGTLVGKAFTRALEQRGMLAANGPYRFQVTVHTLYGDQYAGRKAELLIDLAVIDRAGRTVYADRAKDGSYEFTFFDNGIFASIDQLRGDVEKLLNKDIDAMLDKAAFRNAVSGAPPVIAGVPAS